MPRTISVTLSDDQVQAMLADARVILPGETGAQLVKRVEDAAKHTGIYTLAQEWRLARIREQENQHREQELAEHAGLFPPAAEPVPEPGE